MHITGLAEHDAAGARRGTVGDAVIAKRKRHLPLRLSAFRRLCGQERAAQILEFALSLPVLLLFVIGIFDFSSALTLKLKLTNAARDGARVAAADSGSDLGKPIGVPASVGDSYQVVDNHLLAEKINDCGLNGTTPTATGLVWKSPALTGCPGGTGMVLTIDRGCISKQTLNGVSTDVVNTCVTIQYPYQWRYGGVAGLVGGTFIGPTTINVTATALNEN
jgi:Flp pilus assembly protein TadG